MDVLITTVFFTLLVLLTSVAYRADMPIVYWSLLIFGVLCGVFVFYRYVHEYEQEHGRGSWRFDPFGSMRSLRGRSGWLSEGGSLRAGEERRLRAIMRDLDFTESEVDAYIEALTLDTLDRSASLNDLLLFEEELKAAERGSDGRIVPRRKREMVRRFKTSIASVSDPDTKKGGGATPPVATPPAASTTTKGGGGKRGGGKKGGAASAPPGCPPAASEVEPKCSALGSGGDLDDLDFQLFRSTRDVAAVKAAAGCTKCALDEFDGASPEGVVPSTVKDYTLLLLGDKQKAIDDIVVAVQKKCFATTGTNKTKARHVLSDMFGAYFFSERTPTLPRYAADYLARVKKAAPEVSAGDIMGGPNEAVKNTCRMDVTKMKARQYEFTAAVKALYRTWHNAVEGARLSGRPDALKSLFTTTSVKGTTSTSSALPSIFYTGVDESSSLLSSSSSSSSGTSGVSSANRPTLHFTEADLEASITTMFDTGERAGERGRQARCDKCVLDVMAALRKRVMSTEHFEVMRRLRHTPIVKSVFMVQFLRAYFDHFVGECVEDASKVDARENLHVYGRKLLAMVQLMWAVILQSSVAR